MPVTRPKRRCADCKTTLEAIAAPHPSFAKPFPIVHCPTCDRLEVMSDPRHHPAVDEPRPPAWM